MHVTIKAWLIDWISFMAILFSTYLSQLDSFQPPSDNYVLFQLEKREEDQVHNVTYTCTMTYILDMFPHAGFLLEHKAIMIVVCWVWSFLKVNHSWTWYRSSEMYHQISEALAMLHVFPGLWKPKDHLVTVCIMCESTKVIGVVIAVPLPLPSPQHNNRSLRRRVRL